MHLQLSITNAFCIVLIGMTLTIFSYYLVPRLYVGKAPGKCRSLCVLNPTSQIMNFFNVLFNSFNVYLVDSGLVLFHVDCRLLLFSATIYSM